ncbi:hypothetical protein FRC12_014899 [Ceratobasidium sp. 428]|nr:hypothetical protein FRC12_014899 [Ceratobasidium sp. 428]
MADHRVTLPSLRSLVLAWQAWDEIYLSWVLGVMDMVDCPAVQHLELDSPGVNNDQLLRLADQILPSNVSGSDNTSHAYYDQPTLHNPLYPALRSLHISRLLPRSDCAVGFRALLSSLSTISVLVGHLSVLELLAKEPILLPRLEHIKFLGPLVENLGNVLCQISNGTRLKTLEIPAKYMHSIHVDGTKSLAFIGPFFIGGVEYDSGADIEEVESEDDYSEDDEAPPDSDVDDNEFNEDTPDGYDNITDNAILNDAKLYGGEIAMNPFWQRVQVDHRREDEGKGDKGGHSGGEH